MKEKKDLIRTDFIQNNRWVYKLSSVLNKTKLIYDISPNIDLKSEWAWTFFCVWKKGTNSLMISSLTWVHILDSLHQLYVHSEILFYLVLPSNYKGRPTSSPFTSGILSFTALICIWSSVYFNLSCSILATRSDSISSEASDWLELLSSLFWLWYLNSALSYSYPTSNQFWSLISPVTPSIAFI